MTKCKICKKEIKGHRLGCSLGTICMNCSKEINLATLQPMNSHNSTLWCLAETFFRKGKGEDVTFEQVWKELDDVNLIKFDYLYNLKKMDTKDEDKK